MSASFRARARAHTHTHTASSNTQTAPVAAHVAALLLGSTQGLRFCCSFAAYIAARVAAPVAAVLCSGYCNTTAETLAVLLQTEPLQPSGAHLTSEAQAGAAPMHCTERLFSCSAPVSGCAATCATRHSLALHHITTIDARTAALRSLLNRVLKNHL